MEIEKVKSTTWGTEIRDDVFDRWTQGFAFCDSEPLALIQYSGGPCAVLAPVQAFILQKHLFDSGMAERDRDSENWRRCNDAEAKFLLLKALLEILKQASGSSSCKIAYLGDKSLNRTQRGCGTSPSLAVRRRSLERRTNMSLEETEDKARESRLKRKYPFSNDDAMEEEEVEEGGGACVRKKEFVSNVSMDHVQSSPGTTTMPMEILPPDRMAAIMRKAAETSSGRSRPTGRGISKEYLSSVLSSLQQPHGGSGFSRDNTSNILSNDLSSSLTALTNWFNNQPYHKTVTSESISSITTTTAPTTKDSHSSAVKMTPGSFQSSRSKTHTDTVTTEHANVQPTHSRPSSQGATSSVHTPSSSILSSAPHTIAHHTPPLLHNTARGRSSKPSSGTITNLHLNIEIAECHNEDTTMECMLSNISDFEGPFGVILFLYSVILTKGIEKIMEDREEKEQPLIDPIHGHGSQSLVNLLLVGHAVTNVFDLDRDLGGIKLRGIPAQSNVGFLTLLEALRYTQVGNFLKTPVYPVWVVGSETHLTVLFSTEVGLMCVPDPQAVAKREFSRFDSEGIGMIESKLLGELLDSLKIENNPEFITMIEEKLDDGGSGVILLSDFLEEFFPKMDTDPPKAFPVYHYNGLQHSSEPGKMAFSRGNAVVLDEVGGTNSDCTLINCLHTKWPGLIVHWDNNIEPKII